MATIDIQAVQAEAAKLTALWDTAQQQYEARKAKLASQVDEYVASHQNAADSHTAEIKAAQAIKSALVPTVAGIETAGSELNQFMLTMPWYQRLVAFFKRNWRWFVYGFGLVGLVSVASHLQK